MRRNIMHLAVQTNTAIEYFLDMSLPELQEEFDNYNQLVEEYKAANKGR